MGDDVAAVVLLSPGFRRSKVCGCQRPLESIHPQQSAIVYRSCRYSSDEDDVGESVDINMVQILYIFHE